MRLANQEAIAVVGTASWGTTLAMLLARKGMPVVLWARTETEAALLNRDRENRRFLPGIPFPPNLVVTASPAEALGRCPMLILAVPAKTMRANLRRLRGYLREGTILLSATKGLEEETGQRMSEVIAEEAPSSFHGRIAALSGPNLAREIALGLPAATVVAAREETVASGVQQLLRTPSFRVYTNSDVIGVELAGALKNIIALGAGICDGLKSGDNAKAAIMTRGLAEIARLGVAMGAHPLTFAGLAGLGDLVATCASPYSRNRYVGEELAKGRPLADIQASMTMVAEGVSTAPAARRLAQLHNVEMPITILVCQVLFEGKDPREAGVELMSREPKHELEYAGQFATGR